MPPMPVNTTSPWEMSCSSRPARPRANRSADRSRFPASPLPQDALGQLVRDHFAILKVGPAVTFALREALWALDAIEREWIAPERAARLRQVTLECMRSDPRHWVRHYPGDVAQRDFHLDYSLSDRIRYYWTRPEVIAAQQKLFANLVENPPPAALLSQYFPESYPAIRSGHLEAGPEALVIDRIGRVLDGYRAACHATEGTNHA